MPTQQQQSARDQINQLLNALGDQEIATVRKFVEFVYRESDPLTRALEAAPLDDEPYTEEQQREDAEARAAFERGEGIPDEVIRKDLGL